MCDESDVSWVSLDFFVRVCTVRSCPQALYVNRERVTSLAIPPPQPQLHFLRRYMLSLLAGHSTFKRLSRRLVSWRHVGRTARGGGDGGEGGEGDGGEIRECCCDNDVLKADRL